MVASRGDRFYERDSPGHVQDFNFKELNFLLKKNGFNIVNRKGDGISLRLFMSDGRTIIPNNLIPLNFQDSLIVKAEVIK